MVDYQGSCHCGTVKFEFSTAEIKEGLRCNCSICRRKGAVMLPQALSSEQLKIDDIGSDALRSYKFGTEVAEHFFCEKCGIYTFHETKREPGKFRVNLGCVEGIDVFELEIKVFDGASL
ncbi:aldehyde-activating protein [Oleiphilus sp. HI0079]|uniref:GFA family protein n=1 Tax=Oleiphilus sp. HI0079 TaxID=1822254 RepID=UPI0007C209D1|nr:GFA family protein [Oleiphilus sp. HI0079]KZZ15084.1 aldehyde-activating protein [Oleiphilus sp. HI0079]KZZ76302.1 aldehyde-activating protein [Oleiphilus sp. HI0133]KZZ80360.1 aldehyde-activating protein [Oleiphilus sp. HI0133]